MAGEADAPSGLTENLQNSLTFMSEEEMYEVNQPDGVLPELVEGGTQRTISIDEDAPALLAVPSASRLLKEKREMDAVVPGYGGPSTRTWTTAREGDELGADSRRLSEEGWRQTATTNIDASETDCGMRCFECLRRVIPLAAETDCGKRCFQCLLGVIPLVSAAYSRVMRPSKEEPLLSERDRAEIAAVRVNFFERMAFTGNPVVEDAAGLSEDSRTLELAGEERVTKGLVRSFAEKMQAEGKRLESLEQKAKMASTSTYPRDIRYLSDEDRNERANTQTNPEKEDVLARGSKLLQTAASEPALLDFKVEVPPTGRSDTTAMFIRMNYSTPIEPDYGESAETGEPNSPCSPREPAGEEATLARLINSPARPGGLANASHLELARDLQVALADLTVSPQMQNGLANATHMELSQESVQAMAETLMQISLHNTGLAEQEEQVQEQINERPSLRVRQSRSPERYRPYPGRLPSSLTSPHRTLRERWSSRHPRGSLSRDPTQIASCSSIQEINPGRPSLEADGYFSPRRNVRRPRRSRANKQFLDYCSSEEKIVESE